MSTVNQVANGATATSATTGLVATGMTFSQWVSGNVIMITVGCTVASLLIGLVFHIINTKMNSSRNALQRAKMISDWQDEGKTDEEIKNILKIAGL